MFENSFLLANSFRKFWSQWDFVNISLRLIIRLNCEMNNSMYYSNLFLNSWTPCRT